MNGKGWEKMSLNEGVGPSKVGQRSYGKGKGKEKTKAKGSWRSRNSAVTEERLDAERTGIIAERQAEMEAVFDRHDTLIRELFQMEHFRMMLGYNPQEAKQEDSNVFREFKEKYDLLEKASPAAGPSRKTRSAHVERRQFLNGQSSISAPVPVLKEKRKGKTQPDNAVIWDILASAKTKGKGKDKAITEAHPDSVEAESISAGRDLGGVMNNGHDASDHLESISVGFSRRKGKGKAMGRSISASEHVTSTLPHVRPVDLLDVLPTSNNREMLPPPTPNGRFRKRTITEPVDQNGFSPRKRRKTEPGPLLPSVATGPIPTDVLAPSDSASAPVKNNKNSTSKRRQDTLISTSSNTSRIMPNRAAAHRGTQSHTDAQISAPAVFQDIIPTGAHPKNKVGMSVLPLTPKFNIKRIKLLIRRPAPPLTNPKQRPPPSRYNSSLSAFLSSYKSLDDQDLDESALQELAATDAALLDRVEAFRKEGRFIPGTDVLFGSKQTSFNTPQRVTTDSWDDVVAAVVSQGRLRSRKVSGKQVAAQVAAKVQSYWDGQAARKERVKAQEERRLRALAKATIKMVVGEWKKAVFHIREQERLKLEAEEVKRGHEHLDAILDQSGHILETQQGDLARGDISRSRSRSSSVSALQPWESDDDEDEGGGGDEEDEEDIEQEDIEGGEEEVDMDESASALLGDGYSRTLGSTPASLVSSLPEPADAETPLEDTPLETPSDYDRDYDGSSLIAVDELITANSQSSSTSTSPRIMGLNLTDYAMGDSDHSALQSPVPDVVNDLPGTHSPITHSLEVKPIEVPNIPDDLHSGMENHEMEALPVRSSLNEGHSPKSEDKPTPDAEKPPAIHTAPHPAITLISPVHENGDIPTSTPPFIPLVDGESPDTIVATPEPKLSPDESPATATNAVPEEEENEDVFIPAYLKPYAVAPVEWNPDNKVKPPLLLRGILRPYQQSGLEWLASLHVNNLNGILADEMGLGKTIQTISLLAHLACDRGIWGPHLIVVPTSVLLNWEMEFKKFLPGFKILSYHGTTKRRKELRQGWNDKQHFNVCITSYTLASRDAHIFKRKAWYYMILDEAHMIKNFKSQRWNILLMFRSFRRLLLTGTPLQNNLTELWALLQFLMSGANFANLKEFGEWFSNPLEKAIEMGNILDDETMQRVSKLHTVLRPYLLRRLKRDVEKELPSKYEHLILCPLSKRQRFLYDEFMSRAHTRDALESGVYQKIANILMQLRKVCNHPDLFEVRPIVTSFAMQRAAIADFEIKELLIRRQLIDADEENINLDVLGLQFINRQNSSMIAALESQRLDGTSQLPFIHEIPGEPPPKDTRTIIGFRHYTAHQRRADTIARWTHIGYLNRLRCNALPIYGQGTINIARRFHEPLFPLSALDTRTQYLDTVHLVNSTIKSYASRAQEMAGVIDRFAFVTSAVVALDMPRIALSGQEAHFVNQDLAFDDILHRACVKLQIAFPDPSLLQYDCGKLQELTRLLREKKAGGHRVLIFTQMTRILDILEIFLNFHGYLYLRLDGATKIEDRQYITERFNADARVFCFIASSRSGGVGINLTGADTVVFYDSDFNPQMDKQCEDRAHRIGQIRDVHIYRFVSQHTVEEAMLRKANQKRSLDDLVIQKGEFDWRSLFGDEGALTKALGEFEDTEDAHAAAVAAREEVVMEGADEADFGGDIDADTTETPARAGDLESNSVIPLPLPNGADPEDEPHDEDPEEDGEEEGGTIVDYMLAFVHLDYDFFRDWRL